MNCDMAKAIRMNSRLTLLVLISLVVTSCSYTTFTMNDDHGTATRGVILRRWENFSRVALNAFEMKAPCMVAMRSPLFTELEFSTEFTRSTSDTIVLQTRTTPFDDSTHRRRGFVLRIVGDSTIIEDGAISTAYHTPLPTGKPFLVTLRNDGAWVDVRVGHTNLQHFRTGLPATEWVLVRTTGAGSVLVGDPTFDYN